MSSNKRGQYRKQLSLLKGVKQETKVHKTYHYFFYEGKALNCSIVEVGIVKLASVKQNRNV